MQKIIIKKKFKYKTIFLYFIFFKKVKIINSTYEPTAKIAL